MDTKKLRQKILDLAIRGKLVPQDPNDEPASVLLERIREEKKRLVKEGKLKKKDLEETPISEDEKPFEIPESWEWVRIGSIFSMQAGKNVTAADIKAEKSEKFPYQCYGGNGIRGYVAKYNTTGCFPLVGRQGALCGNVNIAEGNFWATEHAVVTNGFGLTEILWQYYFLTALNLNKLATATAQPGLAVSNVIESLIPLPPLAEQKRIANEIERWFTLIDELESNEGDLLKTIDKAKSKILDLAIHGKLVPQDPNDEPAIDLLKRINPKFEPCENQFEVNKLPDSWCWAKLESISTDSADGPFGSNLKKEHYTTNKEVRIIQLSNIGEEGWREENTKYTTFEHLKDISRSEVMPNDVVIAKMMPAGRAILCPNNEKKYVLSSDAVKFHIIDNIDCRFILYAINSDTFRKQVYEDVQGVTRVRTSLQKLRKYCLPIPPYQEQLRIVTKIEELFAVFDSIKESLE